MRRESGPEIGHLTRDLQQHPQTTHLVRRETTSPAPVGGTATISTTTREATTTTAAKATTPATTATVHTRQVGTLGNNLLFRRQQG